MQTSSGHGHALGSIGDGLQVTPIQRRLYAVGDPGWQYVGPIGDRLHRDANSRSRSRRRTTKELNGFLFVHGGIKACLPLDRKHAASLLKDTSSMSYGERLSQAMDARQVDRKTLAAELGISSAAVGQVLNGSTKMFDAVNHTRACLFLKISPLWLADGRGLMSSELGQSQVGLIPVAHPVILDEITVVPTIQWETLKMTTAELPDVFKLAAPDASMAPKVPQGTMVEFTRSLSPRPGDGVLVRDREGHFYLRIYREKRPGHWEAYAINEAYSPLDSQADGLAVVAVLTAVAGRWA